MATSPPAVMSSLTATLSPATKVTPPSVAAIAASRVMWEFVVAISMSPVVLTTPDPASTLIVVSARSVMLPTAVIPRPSMVIAFGSSAPSMVIVPPERTPWAAASAMVKAVGASMTMSPVPVVTTCATSAPPSPMSTLAPAVSVTSPF